MLAEAAVIVAAGPGIDFDFVVGVVVVGVVVVGVVVVVAVV